MFLLQNSKHRQLISCSSYFWAFGAENVHPCHFSCPACFYSIHFSSSKQCSFKYHNWEKIHSAFGGLAERPSPLLMIIYLVYSHTSQCTQEYLFNECELFGFQFKSDSRNIFHSNQNHPRVFLEDFVEAVERIGCEVRDKHVIKYLTSPVLFLLLSLSFKTSIQITRLKSSPKMR